VCVEYKSKQISYHTNIPAVTLNMRNHRYFNLK